MPIHCPITIKCLGPEEFEKLDYQVMRYAFTSQNELGRLCDECAYQADLRTRLLADGFRSVQTEVPITVIHRDFTKKYYLDLVADDALYELKVNSSLVGENETQLLNYILLLGLQRGKLLNFRPSKVQGHIVATSLTPVERKRFAIVERDWTNLTSECVRLRQTICDLLQDWGAFLDFALYQEALVFFLGGADKVKTLVKLAHNGAELGTQQMLTHAPGLAFRLTAFTKPSDSIATHLQRLLALTDLRAIQWINLNHARLELTTIRK
jgi:GxxExxY protein